MDKPILFKTDMVQAILAGRKTQTRRVVKPQPNFGDRVRWPSVGDYSPNGYGFSDEPGEMFYFPYGQIGDYLWVRETWAINDCGSRVSIKPEAWPEGWPIDRLRYIATDEAPGSDGFWWNKRVSIFMPRWASRLTLLIKDVRVERLQDICAIDAIKEGIECGRMSPSRFAIQQFEILWNSINAKPKPKRRKGIITHYESFPWDEADADKRTEIGGVPHHCHPNPWVWVIGFATIHQNIDNIQETNNG